MTNATLSDSIAYWSAMSANGLEPEVQAAALTPSTATIDAGRLLTLERRHKLQGVTLQVAPMATGAVHTFHNTPDPHNAGILSERRMARETGLSGATVGAVAAWVSSALREWMDSGYPLKGKAGLIDYVWIDQSSVAVSLTYSAAE